MTYSELKTNLADYFNRTDLASKITVAVALAESFIFRELTIKESQVLVAGVTTGEYAALPSDFGKISKLTVTYGGAERALDYIALADAPTSTSSTPAYFSFEQGQIRIWGAGDGQAYSLYYLPKVEALSDSNTTNWVLENAPELYFYASALEVARSIKDDQEIQNLTPLVPTLLDSVNRKAQSFGHPLTASLQIKRRA